MDATEATIEGAEILLLMWRNRLMEDMTALMNTMHEGKMVCISRVDVRPSAPHANRFWRRFGCPAHVDCSHIHPFDQNALIGRHAFDPHGNLPVAYPLEAEPEHLRDFLQVVERTFNVTGLEQLPPPPTQGSLL